MVINYHLKVYLKAWLSTFRGNIIKKGISKFLWKIRN